MRKGEEAWKKKVPSVKPADGDNSFQDMSDTLRSCKLKFILTSSDSKQRNVRMHVCTFLYFREPRGDQGCRQTPNDIAASLPPCRPPDRPRSDANAHCMQADGRGHGQVTRHKSWSHLVPPMLRRFRFKTALKYKHIIGVKPDFYQFYPDLSLF